LSTDPSARSTPQWPWSVYSSRQQSAMRTQSSPNRPRSDRRAAWTMPASFQASEPSASLRVGTPKRSTAPRPVASACSTVAPVLSTVSCRCPGRLGMATGAAMPSRTKSGRTREERLSRVSRESRRRAGVRRRRRVAPQGRAWPPQVTHQRRAPATAAATPSASPRGRHHRRQPMAPQRGRRRAADADHAQAAEGVGADGSDDGVHRAGTEQRHGVKAFREGGDQEAAQPAIATVR